MLKHLYGLPEYSLLWYATYFGYFRSTVSMTCDPVDPSLFYRFASGSSGSAEGVLTMQVDDTMFTGTSEFLLKEESHAYRFSTKPFSKFSSEPIQFNGSFPSKSDNGYQASQ